MAGTSKSTSPRVKKPMNIQKIFGLNPVKAFDFAIPNTIKSPDPSRLFGLELEIEHAEDDWATAGFVVEIDGSLRNSGREFISAPMTYANIDYALRRFFGGIELHDDNYSERTSIHVHANCQDVLLPQLTSLLMLYQVFEDVLFNWIGHDRDKNIFCVPWSQTKLTHNALADIQNFVSMTNVERNKYTALNLVPLRSLGTVEWRHMNGHGDVERILQWLRIISHLFRVATSLTHEDVVNNCINLNTTSQYDYLLDFVFQDEAAALRVPNYRILLENGVLNMKYSLQMQQAKEDKPVKAVRPPTMIWHADFAGEETAPGRAGLSIENILARLALPEAPVPQSVTEVPF